MSAAAATCVRAEAASNTSRNTWLTGASLALADLVAVSSAAVLALLLFQLGHSPWSIVLKQLIPALATLAVFALLGLYPVIGLNPALEFQRVILGSSAGYAVIAGILSLCQTLTSAALARYSVGCALTILLVLACRALCRGLCARLPWWGMPVILFGSGPDARAVFHMLQRQCTSFKVVGVFDDAPIAWPEIDRRRVHVGAFECAVDFARQCTVSHAIIATAGLTGVDIGKLVSKYAVSFRHLLVLPGLPAASSVRVERRAMGGMLGLHLTQSSFPRRAQFVKRVCDVILTLAAGLVLFPLGAMIALAVWLDSRGPVFYGHLRIGQANTLFKAWKFRTMHVDADQILSTCLRDPDLQRQWEQSHKLKNDPRVTAIGRILRKISLDEIPQLWNVLTGEMSFVGPRPIVAAEVARYGENFEHYLSVRPGITGLWQVSGRNNTTYEERVELDEYYVRNWSVWLDLYIVGRTVKAVLAGEGAY